MENKEIEKLGVIPIGFSFENPTSKLISKINEIIDRVNLLSKSND